MKATSKSRNRGTKEAALLAAATRLFAEQGYESAKTRDIAALAGCAEGLIHRYFEGKAGLLMAIVQSRIKQEVSDISNQVPRGKNLKDEIRQLVAWEVDRMWADRDFLSIVMPRALLSPTLGTMINKIGPQKRRQVITLRLRGFDEARHLSAGDIEAIAEFVSAMGYLFGFMRPALLREDHETSRRTAGNITKMLLRSL